MASPEIVRRVDRPHDLFSSTEYSQSSASSHRLIHPNDDSDASPALVDDDLPTGGVTSDHDGLSPPHNRYRYISPFGEPNYIPDRVNLPVIGVMTGRTLVVNRSNTVSLQMLSPLREDSSRYHQDFIVDRNAVLRDSMDYVLWLWQIPRDVAIFSTDRRAVDMVSRIQATDRVQDVILPRRNSLQIYMSVSQTTVTQRRLVEQAVTIEPAEIHIVWVLLVFRLGEFFIAQLTLNADTTLDRIAEIACEHFDKEFNGVKWFFGEEQLDSENETPASIHMTMNQSVRMYDVGGGNWEFFWSNR